MLRASLNPSVRAFWASCCASTIPLSATHLRATAGGKGYCVDLLENGELLGVAVGGSREALFDHDYSANWGGRNGFAKVAMLTGDVIRSV